MEENKKKVVMIGIIVVCLGLAIAIWQKTKGAGGAGAEGIPAGEMMWLKCEKCGATYQIEKREYYKYLEEHPGLSLAGPVAIECKKCGERAARRAIKCPNCGEVFFYGSVPGDFGDRCPKCGYSETEERKKRARQKD